MSPVVEDLDNLDLHSASEEERDPEVPLFDKRAPSLDPEEEKEDEEEEHEEPVKLKTWFSKRDWASNSQSPNTSQMRGTPAHDSDSVTGIVEFYIKAL